MTQVSPPNVPTTLKLPSSGSRVKYRIPPPAVPAANIPSLHELAPLLESQKGRDYLVRVPGGAQSGMDDERLAAVLNWILSNFNSDSLQNGFEPFTAEEVGIARSRVLANPLKAREEILSGT